jgi:hypothetical protein
LVLGTPWDLTIIQQRDDELTLITERLRDRDLKVSTRAEADASLRCVRSCDRPLITGARSCPEHIDPWVYRVFPLLRPVEHSIKDTVSVLILVIGVTELREGAVEAVRLYVISERERLVTRRDRIT